MRVLVFGSSSAEGFWDSRGGWVARLRNHYDTHKIDNPSVNTPWVTNLGVSGDTVNDILERLDEETEMRLKEGRECIFIFQVGSNNAAEIKGRLRTQPQTYQDELERLINKAKKYSHKLLVVGFHAVDETKTTPIAWADLFYKNENINLFEQVAAETSSKTGVDFIPIHQEFIKRMRSGENLQAHDGLHPNDAGHQLIFELVCPALDKLLNT